MKHIRIPRILAAFLIALLAVVVPGAQPARATGESITITPSTKQGPIGQTITITGTGFWGTTANETGVRGVNILFGRHPGSVTMDYSAIFYQKVQVAELWNGTFSTTFTVPSKLTSGTFPEDVIRGTYYIYLTYYFPPSDPSLQGQNSPNIILIDTFNVVAGAITITPASGPAGTEVTINGTFFGGTEGLTVRYDGPEVSTTGDRITKSDGAFAAKLIVPPGIAGQRTIAVSGNNSGTSAQATFTVTPKLTINPTSGPAGTLIEVLGTGFGSQLDITPTFGGDALTPGQTTINGGFSLKLPALSKAAGSYDIVVTDGAGNSDTASFNLTTTALNLSPTNGNVGNEVKINGSNFLPGKPVTITFNDAKVATATSDAQGVFSASFAVPALASGKYKVKVSDGSNTNETEFEITASASISTPTGPVSPDHIAGHVGSQFTITGEGFTPSATVTISYDGKQLDTTATVLADKTFSVTLKVPASSAGEHAIIATDGTNSKQFAFTMESTPPATPVPLKPEMNIKAKTKTYFDWEDVTDPSGVTYTLQISADKDFSQSANVSEKTGLTKSEYTLTSEERLEAPSKEASYYWRVKAVDGAGNQSPWSGTGAFTVSSFLALSPPLTYILIGAGILALVIFAFWLGRRTSYY